MTYALPKAVDVGGVPHEVRTDYRAILDIIAALNDPELDDQEKVYVLLSIFYRHPECLTDLQEAVKQCFWFINCGDTETTRQAPKLMDWEQDFKYIVAPINRVVGQEIREVPYLHWWSFISAYYEIGDCLFAQIVRIRAKKARGKPLDEVEGRFYQDNRDLVDIKTTYVAAEEDLLRQWGGG